MMLYLPLSDTPPHLAEFFDEDGDPDSDDDEAVFQVPQGFVLALKPPEEAVLVVAKENAQADAFVGRKIMYKWDGAGWCVGEIRSRNLDSRRKVNKITVNFRVFYEVDEQEAEHTLSLNNYHQEGNGDAPYHHWVLLEEVKEWDTLGGFGMWFVVHILYHLLLRVFRLEFETVCVS